jgi:hypothetical protein
MTIVITGCADPNRWYSECIGLVIENCFEEMMWAKLTGRIISTDPKKIIFKGDFVIVNK